MDRRRVWIVNIDIVGPITLLAPVSFKQEKGFDQDQFYSDISLKCADYGVAATVTAYAESAEIARMAAFVFLGRMVDVLSFDNRVALTLYDHKTLTVTLKNDSVKRVLNKEEFIAAFNVARQLELEHHPLLKAMGWYAKGENSNNTLDAFLSFWNAIEIVGSQYHTKTDRTQQGAINQIYQCFLDYWGAEENWALPNRWINDMHEMRSSIAHGGAETTAEEINKISSLVPQVKDVAQRILRSVLNHHYPEDIFKREGWMAYF